MHYIRYAIFVLNIFCMSSDRDGTAKIDVAIHYCPYKETNLTRKF